MKTTFAMLLLMLAALSAAAQENERSTAATQPSQQTEPPRAIDASPEKLLELLAQYEEAPEPPGRIEHDFGAVDIRAFNTRFRIGYLPFAMPFVGSRFTISKEWPDAFSVLGVPVATTPRQWARSRAIGAELRRIERTEREKVKATVRVERD